LSAEPTLEELLEVQAYFRLPSPALVEKDFYVVALAVISTVEKARCMRVWCSAGARGRAT
jgi:hypothetical protein